MWVRVLGFLLLLPVSTAAQFSGLSTNRDGSSLFFVSTLRLKGADEPLNGKVFVATSDGVKLFRAHEDQPYPFTPGASSCNTADGFRDYLGTELSTTVTAFSYRAYSLSCSFPPFPLRTEIVSASGTSGVQGLVRINANATWGIVYAPSTARLYDGIAVSFVDLRTGTQTQVPVTTPGFPHQVYVSLGGGRVIADDGTALLAFDNA